MRLNRAPSIDERGATLAEYILLTGTIALVALAGFRVFGRAVGVSAERLAACVGTLSSACFSGQERPEAPLTSATSFYAAAPGQGPSDGVAAFTGPLFVVGKGDASAVSPKDITQGELGDCYLLSAIAAVAVRNPSVIERMIHQNKDGTYTVTFHVPAADAGPSPWWQLWSSSDPQKQVTVDNTFPVYSDGRPRFAQTGDNGTEIWPMVLEKAYAVDHGGYDAMEGGLPNVPLELITGHPSTTIWHDGPGWSFENFAKLWKDGDAIAVGSLYEFQHPENNPLYQGGDALLDGHVYYVTNVDTTNHTISFRNPLGWDRGETSLTWDQFKVSMARAAAAPVDRDKPHTWPW